MTPPEQRSPVRVTLLSWGLYHLGSLLWRGYHLWEPLSPIGGISFLVGLFFSVYFPVRFVGELRDIDPSFRAWWLVLLPGANLILLWAIVPRQIEHVRARLGLAPRGLVGRTILHVLVAPVVFTRDLNALREAILSKAPKAATIAQRKA